MSTLFWIVELQKFANLDGILLLGQNVIYPIACPFDVANDLETEVILKSLET